MVRYRKLESLMTRGPHMVKVRFTEFTTSIVTAYKKVQQIKKIQTEEYAVFGIRAAHVMYLYYMGLHPDGLTVTELANLCCEDKAATSRGIDYLVEKAIATMKRTKRAKDGVQRLCSPKKASPSAAPSTASLPTCQQRSQQAYQQKTSTCSIACSTSL